MTAKYMERGLIAVVWFLLTNLKMIINFSFNLKMIYKLGFVGLKNRQIVRRLDGDNS